MSDWGYAPPRPETLPDEIEHIKGIVGKYFPIYNVQVHFDTISLFCNVDQATLEAKFEELRKEIYQALEVIRVYTKTPGGKPDFGEPVVLKRGGTVEDAAEAIHKDFRYKLKYALVWGSGKFNGQKVKRDHTLEDGDIIELHI